MSRDFDPHRLSSPLLFLLSMVIFLTIASFFTAVLFRQISNAFFTNPGLNGLILGVLVIGILLALLQVIRLIPEVKWGNAFRQGSQDLDWMREPILLAPMKALLGDASPNISLSTQSLRSILDSIGNRLDEVRDISRYLISLLVFLGLLGTFWGLLTTIGSLGQTIQSLDLGSSDVGGVMSSLKNGLKAPLEGMGTAFSSSLFGLAGSLVLGFLDLQAGRAQNRFYIELENWLSAITNKDIGLTVSDKFGNENANEVSRQLSHLTDLINNSGSVNNEKAIRAMASFAESLNQLVQHMRNDQKVLKEYISEQSLQTQKNLEFLKRISSIFEKNIEDK